VGMKRRVVWPDWVLEGDLVYEGAAVQARLRSTACRRCGGAIGRQVPRDSPYRAKAGEPTIGWLAHGDEGCPPHAEVLAEALGVDVDAVRQVIAGFEIPPEPYERHGRPDAPIRPWSHLAHVGYGRQVVAHMPTAGLCQWCGTTSSTGWQVTPLGQSCGDPLCQVWSPGDTARARARLVTHFVDPHAEAAFDRTLIVGGFNNPALTPWPRFFLELEPPLQRLFEGHKWGWISDAVVAQWREALADATERRTNPAGYAERQRREAELEQRVEQLVDGKLRAAGGR
jgi:hypothetical protein